MVTFQIFEMKILHLEFDEYPTTSIEKLQEFAQVISYRVESEEELIEYLKSNQFDVIFTRIGLFISEKLMISQNNLKYIVTSTTGLNHIDTDAANILGIKIISLKGETEFLNNIKSTAEHTWTLLLCLIRNILPATEDVIKNGGWNRIPFLADELNGKTIGIIGFGRLGKIISSYAKAFGMQILITEKNPEKVSIEFETVQLSNLLNRSDFVCLMIDYSLENVGFMSKECFSAMKKGAYFVNTSRGELVDQNALIDFLENGRLKGAALDVVDGDSGWANEYSGDQRLLEYARLNRNLIITPHMGGYGKTSIYKTREFIVNKFINNINN